MSGVKKYMAHNLYIQACKGKTDSELRYIINDAREALDAMPDGINAGFYADEVHYCAMELKKRLREDYFPRDLLTEQW